MLQRPQTLLFIAAAILTVIAAFSPLASYSSNPPSNAPKKVVKRYEKVNPRLVVKTSGTEIRMNYVRSVYGTKKRFEKRLTTENETLDKALDERGLAVLFKVGLIGTLLLAMATIFLIFLYKNRKLQIRLGVTLLLITLMVTTGIFIGSKIGLDVFAEMEVIPTSIAAIDWNISYKYGFFLFPAIAICLLIGVLMIRKDDNLVKSLDRLR